MVKITKQLLSVYIGLKHQQTACAANNLILLSIYKGTHQGEQISNFHTDWAGRSEKNGDAVVQKSCLWRLRYQTSNLQHVTHMMAGTTSVDQE
jgi:hypothetical protein